MNTNETGLDKLLGELSNYKGFIIKFTALMFHDDILPKDVNGDHIHPIEVVVFWFLVVLFIKVFHFKTPCFSLEM